ncbi:type VII secretion protein EccCa [Motilibacter deserti]|uniref:type VII secretion protein EccCa n=1 Tax=Motilibacter deserti TaxID=2714956 RepID=UPI002F2B5F77
MATTLRRGPRLDGPQAPVGEIVLTAPPEIAPHEGSGAILMTALPMLASVGSIVFVATSQPGPRGLIAAGMFLLASLGFVVVMVFRQRSARQVKTTSQRREYLRYLAQVRETAREAARMQREARLWEHPDPAHLPALAEERTRVWERTAEDADFLHVRYGVAPQALSLDLVPPESAPIDLLDPVSASALHRLLVTHRVQDDLPAAVDVRAFSRIEVTGESAERARALVRSLLASAAAFHSPDDLRIAVLCSPQALPDWEWLKWLPHAGSPTEHDDAGPARMVSTDFDALLPLLPDDLADRPRFGRTADDRPLPHVLFVLDGTDVPPGNPVITPDGVLGVTVLDLPETWDELSDAGWLRLHLDGTVRADGRAGLQVLRVREDVGVASGDQAAAPVAEALARRLAPLHAGSGPVRTDSLSTSSDLLALLGLEDLPSLDVEAAWRSRPQRDRLRVPIGIGADGSPVNLDIKEAAQQGMGPHGLVVGATGSGKSELLRTLVLGLTLTHSPDQLNLVLVDFKGGATFAGMADLPHVSAVITNLEQELTLVDRMQDALTGEMVRRQQLLRSAGNYVSLRDYDRARAAGEPLEPLPSLFVVVDEFSELLTAKPEFLELFLAIGRLGRSLGLHLLLASQRLEEGRLRGLDTHLSYRIGLRTFSAAESRTVLGVPDAYELPSAPGLGFLKPDQSTLLRFKAAYVSGPPRTDVRVASPTSTAAVEVLPFTLAPVQRAELDPAAPAEAVETAAAQANEDRSVLELAVDRLAGRGPQAHQVWLPPLEASTGLDALIPDLVVDDRLGLVSPSWRAAGSLSIPVGTVDKPLDQRRETLVLDLAGAAGHVAVVGAPRSGKSALARTVVTALALTRTPQEVQFYVLDFGGGTFSGLEGLPHLSGVATRGEPDVVRRVVAEVQGIVSAREAYFRSAGIDSIEAYRSRRASGLADDGYGDVFLVVDGWSTLRAEFEELEAELQYLAQRGLTYGVHLVATATRWTDFRTAVRDLLGTRLELRLGDPLESEVDRKVAQNVPVGRPGRGLLPGKHHFLAALPRVDGSADPATLADGVAALVKESRDAWRGPQGPRLRLLPTSIALEDVRAATPALGRELVVGVDERALAPVTLDVDSEPHLLVFGDSGSGKSAALRGYLREVMRSRTEQEAQVVVVDYRRALLGEVPPERLVDYLTSRPQAEPALAELAAYLRGRIPGPDVTPEQLRRRSWWTGADVFVVVDDYDLVATSSGPSPLQPLVELLPQAREIGLHVVVARRSGGASRALFEPVIQTMRDLSMPALLLSGSPDEGPLVGNVRPRPADPGRAQLVTRSRGKEVVQLAWSAPLD